MVVIQVYRGAGEAPERVEVEKVVRGEYGITCYETRAPDIHMFIPYTSVRMVLTIPNKPKVTK